MLKSRDRSIPKNAGDKTGGYPVSADESEAKVWFFDAGAAATCPSTARWVRNAST